MSNHQIIVVKRNLTKLDTGMIQLIKRTYRPSCGFRRKKCVCLCAWKTEVTYLNYII